MKKRLTSLLVALGMTVSMLSFTACDDKKNESSSSSGESSPSAENGEFITDPDEPELGEYTLSASGIKHYYNPDEISPEIMAALEKYFVSYSQSDYETYTECVYPEYITEMNEYLERDYGYDQKQSFENQCETLKTNAGGDFKITRIKAELATEDFSESYFEPLNEVFGYNFYDTVSAEVDKFHDIIFYIIVEANGEETLLISEFEILFAEKDGMIYTFG